MESRNQPPRKFIVNSTASPLTKQESNIASGHVDAFAKTVTLDGKPTRVVSIQSVMQNLDGTALALWRKSLIATGAVAAAHAATHTPPWKFVEVEKVTQNHPKDAGIVNADGKINRNQLQVLINERARMGYDGTERLYQSDIEAYLKDKHDSDPRKDPLGLFRLLSLYGEWGTLKSFFPNRTSVNPNTNKQEWFLMPNEVFLCYNDMPRFLDLAKDYHTKAKAPQPTPPSSLSHSVGTKATAVATLWNTQQRQYSTLTRWKPPVKLPMHTQTDSKEIPAATTSTSTPYSFHSNKNLGTLCASRLFGRQQHRVAAQATQLLRTFARRFVK